MQVFEVRKPSDLVKGFMTRSKDRLVVGELTQFDPAVFISG